ncbi:hypothetical protein G6F40_017053 [Rhizopus arrhizus]|nr:hypothetical protein G6F40_017053 [Rhizopus arrhizus]
MASSGNVMPCVDGVRTARHCPGSATGPAAAARVPRARDADDARLRPAARRRSPPRAGPWRSAPCRQSAGAVRSGSCPWHRRIRAAAAPAATDRARGRLRQLR